MEGRALQCPLGASRRGLTVTECYDIPKALKALRSSLRGCGGMWIYLSDWGWGIVPGKRGRAQTKN